MLRANLLDDPIMQPVKSVRVPRFTRARRREQIRIRRVLFMFFYKKFHCVLWGKNRSDGVRRFRRADDQFPILPRDAFVDRECTVLNVQVLPPQCQQFPPGASRWSVPDTSARGFHAPSLRSGTDRSMLLAEFSFPCECFSEFCISLLGSQGSIFPPPHAPTLCSAPHERIAPCEDSDRVLSAPAGFSSAHDRS